MCVASIDELDEVRPTLDDGNFFLSLCRAGQLDEAKRELKRLTIYYARDDAAVPCRPKWREWCAAASEFLDGRNE